MAREHMAAFKIQRRVRRFFGVHSIRRINAAIAARQRKQLLEDKKKMLFAKRTKALHNLRDMLINMYASRIQRRYRFWKREKSKREEAERKRAALVEINSYELNALHRQKDMAKYLPNPVRMAREAYASFKAQMSSNIVEVAPWEAPRLQNGILRFQTMSILKEGIIEIALTFGEVETTHFLRDQDNLRRIGDPYFVQVPNDLSGSLQLEMYLWVMYGQGVECICQLEVHGKPAGQSIMALKNRHHQLRHEGIKLAWHGSVPIEFHGICSIKQGKGGYGIGDIVIATSTQVSRSPPRDQFLQMSHE
jgi:hypothetical protein